MDPIVSAIPFISSDLSPKFLTSSEVLLTTEDISFECSSNLSITLFPSTAFSLVVAACSVTFCELSATPFITLFI